MLKDVNYLINELLQLSLSEECNSELKKFQLDTIYYLAPEIRNGTQYRKIDTNTKEPMLIHDEVGQNIIQVYHPYNSEDKLSQEIKSIFDNLLIE